MRVSKFIHVGLKLVMEIVFLFLKYWGLHHNWDMCNAFVFDGRHGVKATEVEESTKCDNFLY